MRPISLILAAAALALTARGATASCDVLVSFTGQFAKEVARNGIEVNEPALKRLMARISEDEGACAKTLEMVKEQAPFFEGDESAPFVAFVGGGKGTRYPIEFTFLTAMLQEGTGLEVKLKMKGDQVTAMVFNPTILTLPKREESITFPDYIDY